MRYRASPRPYLVEAVAEVEVGPAVGGGDGLVHLDVEVA
jgi:hypothetical protein